MSPSKVLPGCSKGKDHKQPWEMSTHHMKAYLVMKGQGGPDADDPMLRWMARSDKKAAEEAKDEGEEPSKNGQVDTRYP